MGDMMNSSPETAMLTKILAANREAERCAIPIFGPATEVLKTTPLPSYQHPSFLLLLIPSCSGS
jgi:hypothetical protein